MFLQISPIDSLYAKIVSPSIVIAKMKNTKLLAEIFKIIYESAIEDKKANSEMEKFIVQRKE